jgi:hypothetical protein
MAPNVVGSLALHCRFTCTIWVNLKLVKHIEYYRTGRKEGKMW